MATETDSLDESDHECPTCGRTDFKTPAGMKVHHASVHDESLSMQTLVCDQCGGEFERRKSENGGYDHTFCSEDCWGDYMAENCTGEDSPAFSGDTLTLECDNCNREFQKPKSRVNRSEYDYCSLDCNHEHLSEVNVGKDHPRYSKVEVDCANCGNTLTRHKCRAESYERQFCDMECRGEWNSEHVVGENHPNFTREKVSIGRMPEWFKDEIRSRDGYKCQDCGMNNTEHLEEYDKQLHIHHIVPRRLFEDPEKAHADSNLISLCYSCHGKWEQMPFLKPE